MVKGYGLTKMLAWLIAGWRLSTCAMLQASPCATRTAEFGLHLTARFTIFRNCVETWKNKVTSCGRIATLKQSFMPTRSTGAAVLRSCAACLLSLFGTGELVTCLLPGTVLAK